MKIFTNFDAPTQVMFYDGDEYHSGIAYRDEIICGCCGGIFNIEDINEMVEGDKIVPIIPLAWIDIDACIGGYPSDELQDIIDREGLAD